MTTYEHRLLALFVLISIALIALALAMTVQHPRRRMVRRLGLGAGVGAAAVAFATMGESGPGWQWVLDHRDSIPVLALGLVIGALESSLQITVWVDDWTMQIASAGITGSLVGWLVFLAARALLSQSTRAVRGTSVESGNSGPVGPRHDQISIGGVVIPPKLETRGIMLVGSPGTGKTQAIRRILRTARARGDRVICIDASGDLLRSYYDPQHDTILCPGDQRSVAWSPYAEMRGPGDAAALARSVVPPGHGSAQEWNGYARTLIESVLRRSYERGERTTGDLLRYLTIADPQEVGALVHGLPAQRLFSKGAERMLSSVMGIVGSLMTPWADLPAYAGANAFSLRRWVEGGAGWLWLPYHDDPAVTAPLRRAWIDVIIRAVLSLNPDPDRRIWLVLDELPSHGQLDSLPLAVARGRKYGLSLIAGYQTIAQLREVYGRDSAESIAGCTGHSLILRSPDPDTSDYLSRRIGEVEQERVQVTRGHSNNTGGTPGAGSSSSSESRTTVREIRRAVLPSEIAQLPDLYGYLLIAEQPIRRVRIPIVNDADYHPAFVPAREEPRTEPAAPAVQPPAEADARDEEGEDDKWQGLS